ncbi:MAG: autotransporter outer membrane beta-barrel domain-containing protein [Devosia sp.]
MSAAALLAAVGLATAADEEVGVTNSQSWSESLSFNPATVITNTTTVNSTQVIGRLQGGAPLYDQTFAVAFSDPLVQAGLDSAYAAVSAGGGPGVVIGSAQLTASSTTTTSNSVTVYSLVSSVEQAPAVVMTFGPDDILVGQLSECDLSELPSTTAPTCTTLGTPYALAPGETNFNEIINTLLTIDRDTTVTETTTIFEQYTITGVVQAVGVVHAAVQSGALDAGGRFLRTVGDAANGEPTPSVLDPLPGTSVLAELDVSGETLPIAVWAEAYGTRASNGADGSVPGDVRTSGGLAAGIAIPVSSDWTLAIGLDHGSTSVALDSEYAETASIGLTQLGLSAGYASGPWVGTLGATLGFGTVDTVHDVAGTSTASYDLATLGLLAEIGYAFALGDVQLTPSVGLDYTAVHTDAFTETGGLALVAREHSTERLRAVIGLDVARTWDALRLSAHARLVGVLAGAERELPVAYVDIPDAPMTLTGSTESPVSLELGGRLDYDLGNNASLFAGYDGRLSSTGSAHSGQLGFRVEF